LISARQLDQQKLRATSHGKALQLSQLLQLVVRGGDTGSSHLTRERDRGKAPRPTTTRSPFLTPAESNVMHQKVKQARRRPVLNVQAWSAPVTLGHLQSTSSFTTCCLLGPPNRSTISTVLGPAGRQPGRSGVVAAPAETSTGTALPPASGCSTSTPSLAIARPGAGPSLSARGRGRPYGAVGCRWGVIITKLEVTIQPLTKERHWSGRSPTANPGAGRVWSGPSCSCPAAH